MTSFRLSVQFAGAIVMCFPLLTQASVILYEKPLDHTAGYGWNSTSGSQQIAEDFSLTVAGTATDIRFWGFFQTGPEFGAFDILFFNDVGGLPDTSHFSSTTTGVIAGVSTGLTEPSLGRTIHEWSVSLPGVFLPAGDLWVSIRSTAAIWVWSHSFTNGDGALVLRSTNSGSWSAVPDGARPRDAQSFQITGDTAAVPEPASLLLLGLGAAGLLSRARRRRKGAE